MKSFRLILIAILALSAVQGIIAQSTPSSKLVGHWLNRSLFESDDGFSETHVLIHRQSDGSLRLNIFSIEHGAKTSLLEVKHGRWEHDGDTYIETFPNLGETDDYAVVAITDTEFRYNYQEEDDTTIDLVDEKIDAQRFTPPLLPAGFTELAYDRWGEPAPAVKATKEANEKTSSKPAQTRQQILSTAIMNNLRQLAAAAEQYFIETDAKTATLSDLVGPDKYIRILPSHDGEDYSKLIINDRGGKWTVTTASGIVVSYDR